MLTISLSLAPTLEYILTVAEVVEAGKAWGKKSMEAKCFLSILSQSCTESRAEYYPCKNNHVAQKPRSHQPLSVA